MYNTKIQNCNNELLETQKKALVEDIVYGNNKNYFKVIDLECGTGKTLTSEKALAKMVLETNKSAIFVRLTNENCRESAERINNICKNECAFVFNNDDLSRTQQQYWLPKLTDFRILCIAHQKYLSLSRQNRQAFTKGRTILVIDEFPTDVISMKLDLEYINYYKTFFKFDPILFNKYCEIVTDLEVVILSEQYDRPFIKRSHPGIKTAINNLIKLIKANSQKVQEKINNANFP